MSKITLDQVLRSKLNGLSEPLEVCDESGATVGHFLPAKDYNRLIYQLAEAQCPYSEEELQHHRQETGGRTLQEIWKNLGVK